MSASSETRTAGASRPVRFVRQSESARLEGCGLDHFAGRSTYGTPGGPGAGARALSGQPVPAADRAVTALPYPGRHASQKDAQAAAGPLPLVTKERDKAAALKFIKKAMERHGRPKGIVTDGLRSYGAALKEIEEPGDRELCPPPLSGGPGRLRPDSMSLSPQDAVAATVHFKRSASHPVLPLEPQQRNHGGDDDQS